MASCKTKRQEGSEDFEDFSSENVAVVQPPVEKQEDILVKALPEQDS